MNILKKTLNYSNIEICQLQVYKSLVKCNFSLIPVGDGETCGACSSQADCACLRRPCYNGSACYNLANDGVSYACGDCPPGLEGDGYTCTDVDEASSFQALIK